MVYQIIERLLEIDQLKEVPRNQLEWLVEKSDCRSVKQGDYLFKKGAPIDKMYIILHGHFILKIQQNNQFRVIGSLEEKAITGALPYSRASIATGIAEAAENAEVLALDKTYFKEMITDYHELTTAFVHVMSTRIRHFTKLQQQNDKMMALGKLSAGLAHELNNPSGAVIRSARMLRKHLALLPEEFKKVIKIKIDDQQLDIVTDLLFDKIKDGVQHIPLMEKTDREDSIASWLEEHDFNDGYEAAENFVDFNFTEEDMDTIAEQVNGKDLVPVVNWLNQVLATEKLVNEIEDASQRINDLVKSVKSYTHMDQAPEKQPANIHTGIDNTLTMLNHKLKKAHINVIKKYQEDLPKPMIYISELNQVWTNLIDNAIDALEDAEHKNLEIQTKQDGSFVKINIVDSGKGIPDEVKDQIFDPFFTTKAIGKGTGLGLDIVQQIISQHNGTIDVDSKPGRTEFKICIPIA
ncbi:hypothetical protein C900_00828 [Fulvivirga imtechensis AK7]|uniref:histidine kinase n=1 Tax=Fulvivirga imtechensis AK7 TaxID=1237149 RepID=L8K067_9BACT|nr:ATP-binding protein [Fulvivirga imtechensis]ELR72867.1 hypothetical protein C900_00828 [Fulvivirga imtechensis AK7]